MTHEECKERLAEHALGALEAAEARTMEEHLSACAACRAELSEWSSTVAALAYSAPLAEPPVELRSRLLENIRAIKVEPSGGARKRPGDAVEAREKQSLPVAINVIPLPVRSSGWSGPQKFWALAASVAFAALIVMLFVLWNRNLTTEAQLARLNRDLQTTQEQLRHEQEISRMFIAPDTRVATLSGTEMAPHAHARLAYNKAGGAMMIVDELPPAPAGKDYQIWFIADGKPMPGGVFKPDEAGHVEMHAEIPVAARNAVAFAVTLEPQGGTAAPTGQKYLLGTASS
jgi:anti-sigma-K factor RskA